MSEFGKGLTYCIGLFLMHSERKIYENAYGPYTSWFNGASDHLYELVIPDNFNDDLKNRLDNFRTDVLRLGHGFEIEATKEDKEWGISEAKELLILIDIEYGIESIKGDNE